MKVLEKGTGQRGWATEATCTGSGNGMGGCGAKLLVEQGDLFKTYNHVYNETTTYITFRCVSCGVLTDLKNVPSAIRSKVRATDPQKDNR